LDGLQIWATYLYNSICHCVGVVGNGPKRAWEIDGHEGRLLHLAGGESPARALFQFFAFNIGKKRPDLLHLIEDVVSTRRVLVSVSFSQLQKA